MAQTCNKSSIKYLGSLLFLLVFLLPATSIGQTWNKNFIRTRVPRRAIQSTIKLDQLTGNKDSVMVTVNYVDGLGRPSQTIGQQASPAGKDIVQIYSYDQYDREVKKLLPFASTGSAGNFVLNADSEQSVFYNPSGDTQPQLSNGVARNKFPYAETLIEPSALSRVLDQSAPGDNWQFAGKPGAINPGHTVKTDYGANNGSLDTASGTAVALYKVTINPDFSRTLTRAQSNSALYDTSQISVVVSKDENWKSGRTGTVEEYKDLQGKTILKRAYNYANGVQILSTYYVYDDLGNLSFVLPPGASPDTTAAITKPVLDNLCYQYQYDDRNRLIQKKLPGKGWEYLVYNQIDQVVATQDSLQRGQNNWLFTKYDALGRVALTGVWNNNGSAITRVALQNIINGQSSLYESRTPTGNGYSNIAWPTSFVTTTLTLSFYDGYVDIPGLPANFAIPLNVNSNPVGLLTVSQTNVLGTSNMLWQAQFYDDLGRTVKAMKQHYLAGTVNVNNYDSYLNSYSFNNEITGVQRQHFTASNTSSPALTINSTYSYDHTGRKKDSYSSINTATQTLLSRLSYNDIGQLYVKILNGAGNGLVADTTLGTSSAMTSGQKTIIASNRITLDNGFSVTGTAQFTGSIAEPSQTITYLYNERGWLSQATSSLFSEKLQYNEGISPQYNGNIANQLWGANLNFSKSYAYKYDKLNRLTSGVSSDGFAERGISYDKQGNIISLSRLYNNALIDSLSYSYLSNSNKTNQLQGVVDKSPDAGLLGYKAGTGTYFYDGNGNMKQDGSKGITSISYNILNLPTSFAGKNTTYVYDATGNKLRRVVGTTITDYLDGIQYDGGGLSFIQTEEGRAFSTSSGYRYEYTIKDHLGNNRVSFDTFDGLRVTQQDDYLPFGMEISRGTLISPKNEYLYNGKELQENLQLYDYGARFYDPVVARWTSVDPLAEKGRRLSPYTYAFNNPIRFIDPDGMWGDIFSHDGAWLYNDGKKDHKAYVLEEDSRLCGGIGGPTLTELKLTIEELVDMAAIAYAESSGNHDETFAFSNVVANNMGDNLSEAQATSGNFSYEKSNNTSRYSGFKKTSDEKRNGTKMQEAMAGAINAVTGGKDYSNGAKGWDGVDVLQGSPNSHKPNHHNNPEDHYRQQYGGITDPLNLAPTFYNNARSYIGQKFGVGGREYNAVQPLILNNAVPDKNPYKIVATHGGTVFYDHR